MIGSPSESEGCHSAGEPSSLFYCVLYKLGESSNACAPTRTPFCDGLEILEESVSGPGRSESDAARFALVLALSGRSPAGVLGALASLGHQGPVSGRT